VRVHLGVPLAAVRPRAPGAAVPLLAPQSGYNKRLRNAPVIDRACSASGVGEDAAVLAGKRREHLSLGAFRVHRRRRRGRGAEKGEPVCLPSPKASPCRPASYLERHGSHTTNGVIVRVLQSILTLVTGIWHNDKTGAPTHRSLTAYDH
jgi:hypothetical protein